MKRVGYLMNHIVELDNLCEAYCKARRGKRDRREVVRYAEHLDDNLRQLQRELMSGHVTVGHYRYFVIHDPKERTICAAPFGERVMQHALMNVCHPYFDRTLIDTTFATRKGKGAYAALACAQQALRHYAYTVKLDVRKYYDSISHQVLMAQLHRLFKDARLLQIFESIIDSYHTTPGHGLPIGNLTSQYFANLYLSALDHRVKEVWHVPVYIRYMDDMLLAAQNRTLLRHCVDDMEQYVDQTLALTLKPPIYRRAELGQVFLGYRLMPHCCYLSGRGKRRFRSKLLVYNKLLAQSVWDEQQYAEHILPLLAFALHADSRSFRRACLNIDTYA